ncbi:ubiquitin fusion degradation protein I [Multifurca ochricompacta]|uniref:Ubiquitin fusion degradation protein I n=1 Tax=Multifurca ochricompacta TaxID=376703 RepID=A0AAD4M9P3_9AGAM|nr:ubiquitin fusion degradation protein I [Multifurca ochricompacta]
MNFFGEEDDAAPGGPAGLFAQFAQGFGGGFGYPRGQRSNPGSYDEYLKAYSVAMLPGRERENLSYGGKIILPPSALAQLTSLDLESPWMFKLRNPQNPAASTHAGVLEFIAEEGVVHLPYWMMKTLRLNEGDPVRITGTELLKGRFVKLQAQHVHFLEISDPKAVLEQALRNFTALTQGDIIEISYNSIIFGLLVMETTPGGEGISILDTDLEVDFAPPVGYVEPERPKAAPPSTMASKLNIDLSPQTPGSSRPASSIGGNFAGTSKAGTTVSKDGDAWETFKGRGETLGGRKTKGRGITHRAPEQVPVSSKIIRTDQHRVVVNEDLESEGKIPAPLNLPFGKLFFGFNIPPYTPPSVPEEESPSKPPTAFVGAGNSLNGRDTSSSTQGKGKGKATDNTGDKKSDEASWGTGQGRSLGPRPSNGIGTRTFGTGLVGVGGASIPRLPQRSSKKPPGRERSPTPDFGIDDDDDAIVIDSDLELD